MATPTRDRSSATDAAPAAGAVAQLADGRAAGTAAGAAPIDAVDAADRAAFVLVVDGRAVIRSAGSDVRHALRWPPAALAGRSLLELVHVTERDALARAVHGVASDGEPGGPVRHRLRGGDGSWHRVSTAATALEGPERLVLLVSRPDRAPDEAPAPDAALAGELRAAIAAGHVRVHFQPIVSLDDGAVRKVEALVRWEHPERGLIPPIDFVPAAERTGAVVELGEHVLDAACRQLAAWRRSTAPALELTVNLSPTELADEAVVERVRSTLARHGLPPQALWLEVTETAMTSDPARALAVLRRLRDLGVRLAIDDFGTGFANLANLRQYPFLAVKVDRSFVAGLGVDANDMVIVRSILKLAGELGLLVVAEGVETEDQRRLLEEMGCELGQGYLFSRPTAPEHADAWLVAGTLAADDDVGAEEVRSAPGARRLVVDGAEAHLAVAARAAASLLGARAAFVALAEGEGTWVVAGSGVATGPTGPSALYQRAMADRGGTLALAGPMLRGLGDDPLASLPDVACWAAAVVVVDDEVVGVLGVADDRPRELGEEERATLHQLAEQVGAALELRQRAEELDQARRSLARASTESADLAARHAAFEQASQEMFIEVSVDGTIRSVSAAAPTVFGDPESWVGRSCLDLVHPEDLPTAVVSLTGTASQVGAARPIELRLLTVDGYRPMEITSTTFRTSTGHRVLVCARDRASDVGAAAELGWVRATTGAAFDLVEDLVAISDDRGAVRAASPWARSLSGDVERLPIAEWADRLDLRSPAGDRVPLARLPLFRSLQGEVVDGRYGLATGDGRIRPVRVRSMPVTGADGAVTGAVVVLRPTDQPAV